MWSKGKAQRLNGMCTCVQTLHDDDLETHTREQQPYSAYVFTNSPKAYGTFGCQSTDTRPQQVTDVYLAICIQF